MLTAPSSGGSASRRKCDPMSGSQYDAQHAQRGRIRGGERTKQVPQVRFRLLQHRAAAHLALGDYLIMILIDVLHEQLLDGPYVASALSSTYPTGSVDVEGTAMTVVTHGMIIPGSFAKSLQGHESLCGVCARDVRKIVGRSKTLSPGIPTYSTLMRT